MVERASVQLTEAEAQLYDRQIRLWGFEAQKRLRHARVLVIGLKGFGAEIVKNIVLSGVNSVTLLDPQASTDDDRESQLLIPPSEIGKNRALASRSRAQYLNPLVAVEADSDDPSQKPDSFFFNFEVIISCDQTMDLNLRLNKLCRTARIMFFSGSVIGSFGWVFVDLQEHKFFMDIKKRHSEDTKVIHKTFVYPSLEETLAADFKGAEKQRELILQAPLFFVFRILSKFYRKFGRYPTESPGDFEHLVQLKEKELQGVMLPKDSFPDIIFSCVVDSEPSPVCALLGAVVAQEIVKAVTKKDPPVHNMFFFDPLTLTGYAQIVPSGAASSP